MSNDPPPPPSAPPPPKSTDSGTAKGGSSDNPIAVASLIVALLALILSPIILGGIIAIISFVMAIVGLRRSVDLDRGKGVAIGAMLLSIVAVFAAVIATAVWVTWLNTSEETVMDGISTTSTNTEFPPQADIDNVECTTSEGGDSALMIVSITNRSEGQSNYAITVTWRDADGTEVTDSVSSRMLAAGESQSMRAFAPTSDVEAESCRVTQIERSAFPIFSG